MLVKSMGPPPSLRRFIEVAKRFGAKVVEMNGYGRAGRTASSRSSRPGTGAASRSRCPRTYEMRTIAASLFHNWRRRLGIPTDAFYDVSENRPS